MEPDPALLNRVARGLVVQSLQVRSSAPEGRLPRAVSVHSSGRERTKAQPAKRVRVPSRAHLLEAQDQVTDRVVQPAPLVVAVRLVVEIGRASHRVARDSQNRLQVFQGLRAGDPKRVDLNGQGLRARRSAGPISRASRSRHLGNQASRNRASARAVSVRASLAAGHSKERAKERRRAAARNLAVRRTSVHASPAEPSRPSGKERMRGTRARNE